MRVTKRGQVTIPLNVRRHLGIGPGSEVQFELRDGEATLCRMDAGSSVLDCAARELVDHLKRQKGKINLGDHLPEEFYKTLRGC